MGMGIHIRALISHCLNGIGNGGHAIVSVFVYVFVCWGRVRRKRCFHNSSMICRQQCSPQHQKDVRGVMVCGWEERGGMVSIYDV